MLYVDYYLRMTEERIILDSDIDIDKLGYKHGDLFELKNVNGEVQLVKMHPLVKFVKGYD